MSDHDTAAAHGGAHDDAGHGDAGHDDHHAGPVLGAIDWPMWGAGVLGVIAAAIVLAAWVVATQFQFLAAG